MLPGFQFRKSFKLLPGVRVNLSKSGASLSLGPKGAHITAGTRGTHLFLDLPGTGLYYRKKLDAKNSDNPAQKSETEQQYEKLNIGFFQSLVTPADQIQLVNALRELAQGNIEASAGYAKNTTHLADGAFLAGFLAIQKGEYDQAVLHFKQALAKKEELNKHFAAYEINMLVDLPIAEDLTAQIRADERGVLLALARAYHEVNLHEMAIECLQALNRQDTDDLIVKLLLAELLDECYPDAPQAQQDIVKLAENVHNLSPFHATLMFYRARALRKLGLLDGAQDTLTKAVRRKKGYPADLLNALRYERALVYEATGKEDKAKKEFEMVFAETPTYEDVAEKVGL